MIAAIRRLGGRRADAVFGAGCAMGFCYLIAPAWVVADDPQISRRSRHARRLGQVTSRARPIAFNLLRTAFLVVLGGFIKHNLVAIPIAITLDSSLPLAVAGSPYFVGSPRCVGSTSELLGPDAFWSPAVDRLGHLISPRTLPIGRPRLYHLMKYLRLFKFPLDRYRAE